MPVAGTAAKVSDIVETLARSRWASVAAVVVVALACFLPGFGTMAPLDGDEPGYAVAAREMVATGDYVGVRLQTESAELRPRGAYWIEAFAVAVTGGDPPIWVYRLPSLVAAVAAAVATWWLALAFGSAPAALLSGLFVAASGVVGLEARLATPDTILLAAATLSAAALARVWLDRGSTADGLNAFLFWTGLGVGILAKGVIAPAIAAAAILILSFHRGEVRWLKRLRSGPGFVWLFLIVSPWLIALALTLLQGGGDEPSPEFLDRLGVPFALVAPPGVYVLLLPLLAGPCVTFIFLAVRWIASDLARPVVFFSFAWGGPLWLAAELVHNKLPQNILPAIPAVALIAGAAIAAGACRIGGRVSWFYSLGPALWPPLTAAAAPFAFFFLQGRVPIFATGCFVAAAVLGVISWLWIRRGEGVAAGLLSVVTVVFIYLGFFGAFVPGIGALRVGERIAATAAEVVPCTRPIYAATGYPEESLVLALGPQTRLVDPWSAADFLNSAGCRIAAVDASQISAFHQRVEDIGIAVVDRGHVQGFDLRRMRAVDVHLFTTAGSNGS